MQYQYPNDAHYSSYFPFSYDFDSIVDVNDGIVIPSIPYNKDDFVSIETENKRKELLDHVAEVTAATIQKFVDNGLIVVGKSISNYLDKIPYDGRIDVVFKNNFNVSKVLDILLEIPPFLINISENEKFLVVEYNTLIIYIYKETYDNLYDICRNIDIDSWAVGRVQNRFFGAKRYFIARQNKINIVSPKYVWSEYNISLQLAYVDGYAIYAPAISKIECPECIQLSIYGISKEQKLQRTDIMRYVSKRTLVNYCVDNIAKYTNTSKQKILQSIASETLNGMLNKCYLYLGNEHFRPIQHLIELIIPLEDTNKALNLNFNIYKPFRIQLNYYGGVVLDEPV